MRQILVITGVLAVIAMVSVSAAGGMGCGMGSMSGDQSDGTMGSVSGMAGQCDMSDTTSAAGCPMMIKDARMTVRNVPNGVQIELTSADSATISRIREQAQRMLAMRNGMSDASTGRSRPSQVRSSTTSAQTVTYACSMHPEVISARLGSCPKCGMTLVPVRQ